jgi:hypothetical protein
VSGRAVQASEALAAHLAFNVKASLRLTANTVQVVEKRVLSLFTPQGNTHG